MFPMISEKNDVGSDVNLEQLAMSYLNDIKSKYPYVSYSYELLDYSNQLALYVSFQPEAQWKQSGQFIDKVPNGFQNSLHYTIFIQVFNGVLSVSGSAKFAHTGIGLKPIRKKNIKSGDYADRIKKAFRYIQRYLSNNWAVYQEHKDELDKKFP